MSIKTIKNYAKRYRFAFEPSVTRLKEYTDVKYQYGKYITCKKRNQNYQQSKKHFDPYFTLPVYHIKTQNDTIISQLSVEIPYLSLKIRNENKL